MNCQIPWKSATVQYQLKEQTGTRSIENSPVEKDLEIPMDEKLEPRACTCRAEGQLHPGLCQKQWEQQGQGGDSAPQLCPCVTSPAVLCPGLESSAQEQAQRRDTRMTGGWSTCPTKMGGENWSCSAWRREGSV